MTELELRAARTRWSRRAALAILAGALTAATLLPAAAQSYPTRPIRVIAPFPPGGVADVVARLVGQRLSERLGQAVVIENRTGASGTIGVDVVTKAAPDGYTLLITTGDFITTPTLMPTHSYDPNKDLTPVALIATAPLILVASTGSGFNTLDDVLKAAKATPGRVAFSSPGNGTINHLGGEWIGVEGGVKLLHVPYRGGAPAATAIATGEVQLGVVTQPSGMPYVQAGKAKVIGLLSKTKPAFAADLPTLAEAGMPTIEASLMVGLFAPAGTPAAITSKLESEVAEILKDETIRQRLNGAGTEAQPMSGADFAARIKEDAARYARVIQVTGMKAEP